MPVDRLTTTEAADRLGISPQRLRRLIATGHLPATRVETQRGPVWEVSPADVERCAGEREAGRGQRVGRPPKPLPETSR